jgi:DNA replication protein DnaC
MKEPQQINQLLPESNQQAPQVNYEEILTPEEIQTALRIAAEHKIAEQRLIEYNRKLREPKQKVKVSAEDYYKWVINQVKETIKDFSISKEEEKLYKLLSLYFTEDKRFEEGGYSLQKGIMLWGAYGCGKTTIMKSFMNNPLVDFGVIPCRRVAEIYSEEGNEIVWRYAKVDSICFDDLGTEAEAGLKQHFGNKKNVLGDIILNYYDTNSSKVFRMHFTTNLGADQIEELYGGRARSRLREMCNLISLEGINDKRK